MQGAALSCDFIRCGFDHMPELYEALETFVSERIWGSPKSFGVGRGLAVTEKGNVIAAILYHNYDEAAQVIEISGAADTARWLERPILHEMFDYPFNRLGCQAVVMRVEANNSRLGRMLPAFGFKKYDIPRLAGRDKTQSIYVLSDDDWRNGRFMKERKNG
jgi:RimJ/RimL family protein N-acetyltransferase